MKYYIKTETETGGQILGFYTSQNKPEGAVLIEVPNSTWIEGQKVIYNTITVADEDITFSYVDYIPPKTPEELILEEHDYKSKQVDDYVSQIVITTSSGKRIKGNYQALNSINAILNSEEPIETVDIWKQVIQGELVYYSDLPLLELSEVATEANKRIQAKHAEIFLGKPNPYASEEV